MSAQSVYASLFKPVGMMAEPKAQGKQRILDQPTFFFSFSPQQNNQLRRGLTRDKIFCLWFI